ncbi:MAG: hypothetical protein WBW61_11765, partial [Rhodanobacteraceae bacterium]
ASGSGLDSYAPQVDAVLGAQLARLVRYIETGDAEAPAEAPAQVAPSAADQRKAILAAWAKQAAADQAADARKGVHAAPESRRKSGKRDASADGH